jgi:hypothetical protein
MIRLGELPARKPVEEMTPHRTSPVLRFLARLLTLIVAFLAWLFVLIGAAAVLLVHLMVAALARGTGATVSAVLPAEAGAKDDMVSAAARLWGRAPRPRLGTTEPAKRPAARVI